jgi:hypothetical protein
MTLSPATEEPPIQKADPAWDEAFLRVESYLRAYGLESRVQLNQVTALIIDEARQRLEAGGAGDPVRVAMDITHSHIGAWFVKAGHDLDWSDERIRVQGRLALVIADLPGRWANYFLGPGPVPAALAAAMGSFQVLPGPEVRLSKMTPETLEFGLLEPGDTRLPSRRVWPPMRAMASWFLIFGLLGVTWAASH